MTKQFDALKERPQTEVHMSDLNLDERAQVRRLALQTGPGRSQFTTIYYIQGDEKQAAEAFVEENRDAIQNVDFSKNRNKIQSNVDQNIYDWILHALGERQLQKFESVVVETRSDGTIWVIDREHFETGSSRRYATAEHTGARITGETLQSLYGQFDEVITESDLQQTDTIDGDVEYVLRAYRDDSQFDCEPVIVDGELAIRKAS